MHGVCNARRTQRISLVSTIRQQKNFALDSTQRTDARAALSELPQGMSLIEAVRLARRGSDLAIERLTVDVVADRFIASRGTMKLRPASVLWYENKLRPVLAKFDGVMMDAVTRPALTEAIEGLPVSQSTKASHYRAARALWRWAKAQEPALAGRDITEGIKVTAAKTDSAGAEFLTVAEVETILRNLPPQHVPAAALLFFAGIRPQEIAGKDKPAMLWKHINFEGKTVSVEASVAKTRSRRVLQGLPETLWHWIAAALWLLKEPPNPDDQIAVSTSQQLIRAIQQAGGFWKFIDKGRGRQRKTLKEWPHDVTRHTFATFYIAAYDDPGKCALLMGHGGNPRMLYTHYLGLATKTDALKFWALRPRATEAQGKAYFEVNPPAKSP
jgi:hypothetical protein